MSAYKHIFIQGNAKSEKFKSRSFPQDPKPSPERDRASHSQKLLQRFDSILRQEKQLKEQRSAAQISTRSGTYIQFSSAANYDLVTKSLENIRSKKSKNWIRLLNIKSEKDEFGQDQVKAIVYIPKGREGFFVKKIKEYQKENYRQTNNPKNASLVNSIEDVSAALLEGLWTDNPQLIPRESSKWCEAWLNVNTKTGQEEEQIALFQRTLDNIGVAYKYNSIIFPERAVLLINANRKQLIELMLQSDLLAEFRAGQDAAGFWINESRIEQQEWVNDLLQRIKITESNVKVCLLDSGVNNGHQLLKPLIDDANTLTVDKTWGTDDHIRGTGHGTLMAGLAAYGQMEQVLASPDTVLLTHKLCSVKILPRPHQKQTRPELWGDITKQGIARAEEIQNPEMILVYCLSVTSEEDSNRGRPSSWSGAVDNLAYGEGENPRLIIVSAGNIRDEKMWNNYPNSNETSSVQNPAQAWNALVVGAFTDKVQTEDEKFQDYSPLANKGELSPYSSTSLTWEKKWPVKPDVVFEGGNILRAPDNTLTAHEDLELLSTSKAFNISPFGTINATSAAAAQASWFAAKIAYEYPNARPETIRGLIVHSANWEDAMLKQQDVVKVKKTSFRNLLRVFGYGIPNLNRALYSKESALTYIAEENIQPFSFKDGSSQAETNEMHFFDLPWPKDLLLEMSEIPVKLKLTLSYFIEPGAGEIGWENKYRYQSHGLRFDVNNIGESEDDFRKRINIAARAKDEGFKAKSGSSRWVIGSNNDNRSSGSIHSDYMEMAAAELAECNYIAVFPVIGWWRERKHLGKVGNKARYSLIVSLETPEQDVDIYTTVKSMIKTAVEINIP